MGQIIYYLTREALGVKLHYTSATILSTAIVTICVALRELQVLALHTDEMKGVAKMFSKEVYITKVAS